MNPSMPPCKVCGDPSKFQSVDGAMCNTHWVLHEQRVARQRRRLRKDHKFYWFWRTVRFIKRGF